MPSYRQCIRFGRAIGWKPKDEVQLILLDFICSNPKNLTKKLRQWGGTDVHSLHGSGGISLGEYCGIGMPVLDQGTRILGDRIGRRVDKLASLVGAPREVTNVKHKYWGAPVDCGFGVVSMYEKGTNSTTGEGKSAQGWTFRNLKIDEAHNCGIEVYATLEPTADVFAKQGLANIALLGVGGYPDSLIEQMIDNEKSGFKCIRVIPDIEHKYVPKGKKFVQIGRETIYNLLDYDARYTDFYVAKRESIREQDWSQHYMCERQHGGSGLIFPGLSRVANINHKRNPLITADIDVGEGGAPSVISFYLNEGGKRDLFDCQTLVEDNIDKSVDWAVGEMKRYGDRLDPGKVRFEGNGPGKKFGISLERYWPHSLAVKVHTSDQGTAGKQGKKTRWIRRAQLDVAKGKFTVSNEYAHSVLSKLSFVLDEKGNYEWPHNDVLSTVWLEFSGAGIAVGV